MTLSNEKIFLKNILYLLIIGLILGLGIGFFCVPSSTKEYLGDGTLVTTEVSHFKYIVNIIKIGFISSAIMTVGYLIYKFLRK
ncbi:hypothetical protein [Lysinibacillus sp. JNUCC 51]|uniref:hypothetical protein n=1 Tax=Lysinibacillus sp. JNUCC-51 TaxID=2792479 RepID=UPI001937E66C|nr:hypothetical protein JNUCC51_13205 [Lysinibacillus sp. JNUCC-51]